MKIKTVVWVAGEAFIPNAGMGRTNEEITMDEHRANEFIKQGKAREVTSTASKKIKQED